MALSHNLILIQGLTIFTALKVMVTTIFVISRQSTTRPSKGCRVQLVERSKTVLHLVLHEKLTDQLLAYDGQDNCNNFEYALQFRTLCNDTSMQSNLVFIGMNNFKSYNFTHLPRAPFILTPSDLPLDITPDCLCKSFMELTSICATSNGSVCLSSHCLGLKY
jgi:hypothetical protein